MKRQRPRYVDGLRVRSVDEMDAAHANALVGRILDARSVEDVDAVQLELRAAWRLLFVAKQALERQIARQRKRLRSKRSTGRTRRPKQRKG